MRRLHPAHRALHTEETTGSFAYLLLVKERCWEQNAKGQEQNTNGFAAPSALRAHRRGLSDTVPVIALLGCTEELLGSPLQAWCSVPCSSGSSYTQKSTDSTQDC